MTDFLKFYKKYHLDRDNERLGLFTSLRDKFEIKNALYPGSFIHITPSLVFPRVVYVDSYKKTESLFMHQTALDFINTHKHYSQESELGFHKADYSKDFGETEKSFDLLISQYAGFVSQSCKKYLKIGGILAVNNSHGDATMAKLDSDYEFIAVYNRKTDKNYSINFENLGSYFIPKKSNLSVTEEYVEKIQRGIGYKKTASGYIFKRLN